MKSSNRGSVSPSGEKANIIDLISSVNTLIDNLSESDAKAADPVATADRSAVDINRQLKQLEHLFAQSTQQKASRRSDQAGKEKQPPAPADAGACSRSPCSSCTVSNCNSRRSSTRQLKSASITSSFHSSRCRCCQPNVNCYHAQLLAAPEVVASHNRPAVSQFLRPPSSNSVENVLNRKRFAMRRQRPPPQEQGQRPASGGKDEVGNVTIEHIDFGFLKSGLTDEESTQKDRDCATNHSDSVLNIERMVMNLQRQTARLRTRCEKLGNPECGVPKWLQSDILRLQTRVASLQGKLRQTLTGKAGQAGGCRHRGRATEQARDPVIDIKCKFESSLLCNRLDVNWPYLHIIAPRPPTWNEPICCDEK